MEKEMKLILQKIENIDVSKTYKQLMAYNSDGMVEYIGLALPNTNSSTSKWQIRKLTYEGMNVTKIEFAGGSNEFAFVWDNRINYIYS